MCPTTRRCRTVTLGYVGTPAVNAAADGESAQAADSTGGDDAGSERAEPQRWQIGEVSITSVSESATPTSPRFLYDGVSKGGVLARAEAAPWLRPHFVSDDGVPAAAHPHLRDLSRRSPHRRGHLRRQTTKSALTRSGTASRGRSSTT